MITRQEGKRRAMQNVASEMLASIDELSGLLHGLPDEIEHWPTNWPLIATAKLRAATRAYAEWKRLRDIDA